MRVTAQQHPSTKDGVRRAIIPAVRPNYRRMHDTLIPSVQTFFGKDGSWDGPKNGPQTFFIAWDEVINGQVERCELTILFRAFGDESIESFVRGFQPTAWWVNEFDELPKGAISKMASRAGRAYLDERPKDLPPADYCPVFGDCNMPDLDSWVHEVLLGQPELGIEMWLQPSGFSPDAENLENLRLIDANYYESMAARFRSEGDEASVQRFIANKPGYTPTGKPVYPGFASEIHVARDTLKPDPLRQLVIGVDQGGQAAAIIGQRTKHRTAAILREVVLERGAFYGGEEFGRLLGRVMLDEFRHFLRSGGLKLRLDPAAKQRHSATKEDDPRTWALDFIDGLVAETGLDENQLDWDIAPTNAIKKRIGAVKKLLAYRAENANEGMQVHPDCKVTLRGFAGGYRYAGKQGKPGEYNSIPDKNYFSNPHDALQCLALEIVPELAGEEMNSTDPHAAMRAAALEPQGPSWDDDKPTEILF